MNARGRLVAPITKQMLRISEKKLIFVKKLWDSPAASGIDLLWFAEGHFDLGPSDLQQAGAERAAKNNAANSNLV